MFFVQKTVESSTNSPSNSKTHRVALLVRALRSLLPYLVMSVAAVDTVTTQVQSSLLPAEPST